MNLGIALDVETISALLAPLVLGALYFARVGRLRRSGRAPSRARQISFACGIALVLVATVGPIDHLADDFVFGHMVQHTMLLDEASLLLAIGLTGPILASVLRLPGLSRTRALMHPVVALGLWIAVMYAWHLPVFYQAAEENGFVHFCEHACFLAAGTIMWLALFGPFPKPRWFSNPAKALYAGAVHFSSMALANVLMWAGVVLYPFYAASEAAHGVAPLDDQSIAGAVLMVQGGVVMLGVFFWALLRWSREETERQELLDFAHERGVALSEERAARAAASGRGRELRRRLAAGAALSSLLLVLVLAGCGGGGTASTAAQTLASVPGGDAVPARPAPPIQLTDYRGHKVELSKLKGRPVLVAFLYTHCHDLCPLVAADVHTAYSMLKPGATRPVFLAVSVDPAHDTPASAARFNREHRTNGEIDWLLGSRAELGRAWKAWKIVPKRAPNDPEVIEHSAELFGVDRHGDVRVLFPVDVKPEALAHGMERLGEL